MRKAIIRRRNRKLVLTHRGVYTPVVCLDRSMSDDFSNWLPLETSTHQEHVIKHVIGASVLGWFIAGQAVHLLLDMGFLWTIYLDGEMGLLSQGVAISELNADELHGADRAALALDAELLLKDGSEALGLKHFRSAPVECLIETVEVEGAGSKRCVIIKGGTECLRIETSLETGEMTVRDSEN